MQVKGNQKQLLINLKHLCKYHSVIEINVQSEKLNKNLKGKRNRIEKRTAESYKPNVKIGRLGYIIDQDWNKIIKKVIKITRTVKKFNTRTKQWKTSVETAYYICTTARYNIKQLNQMIREHWGIENKNHYVRDVTLEEDKSRIRKNPGIFAKLRSFVLNILRFNNVKNIRNILYKNTLDVNKAIKKFMGQLVESVG